MNNIRKGGRGREALRNDERLYYKFIVKYIEGLHGDLFTKADDFFKDTRQRNPYVRDLTKTVQFMTEVTPNKPIPRHYKYRQPRVDKPIPLLIPLLKLQPTDVTSQPSPAVPVPVSQPSPPVPVSQPSPPVPVSQPSPPVSVSQPSPLLLQPDVYQDLLNEIQRDPELRQIMNDFPDDDESMNDLVWDDIYIPDDISPLEIEIEGY